MRFGRGVTFLSERVRIGDGAILGDGIVVEATEFELGDYALLQDGCFFPGPGTLRIGHNFWLGRQSIVDAQGGTRIADNVGIGAQSQVWGHAAHGDVMLGSRFHGARPVTVGADAWLVGHCLLSPVQVGERSVALLGSVVTRDMAPDRCYAGVPAADITDKVGPPFRKTTPGERATYLLGRLAEFERHTGTRVRDAAKILQEPGGTLPEPGRLVFNVADRTYAKTGSPLEARLIRFLLPDAKFTPSPEASP